MYKQSLYFSAYINFVLLTKALFFYTEFTVSLSSSEKEPGAVGAWTGAASVLVPCWFRVGSVSVLSLAGDTETLGLP